MSTGSLPHVLVHSAALTLFTTVFAGPAAAGLETPLQKMRVQNDYIAEVGPSAEAVKSRKSFQKTVIFDCESDDTACLDNVTKLNRKTRLEIRDISCHGLVDGDGAMGVVSFNTTLDGTLQHFEFLAPVNTVSTGAATFAVAERSTVFAVNPGETLAVFASASQDIVSLGCKFTGEIVKLK